MTTRSNTVLCAAVLLVCTLGGCATQYVDVLVQHPWSDPARNVKAKAETIRLFMDFTFAGVGSDRTDSVGVACVGLRSSNPFSKITVFYGDGPGWRVASHQAFSAPTINENGKPVYYFPRSTEWRRVRLEPVAVRSREDPSIWLPLEDPGDEPLVWVRRRPASEPFQPPPHPLPPLILPED